MKHRSYPAGWEVTGETHYYNASLALHPFTEWAG